MTLKNKNGITAKALCLVVIVASLWAGRASAQLATFDMGNLIQNILNTMENVEQSVAQEMSLVNEARMIEQQYRQAEMQLQNLQSLDQYSWGDAQAALTRMDNAIKRAGALNSTVEDLAGVYTDKYKDREYYENADDPHEEFLNSRDRWQRNQRETATASAALIDQQRDVMGDDADRLDDIQIQAEGAEGNLAVQKSNAQLLAFASEQLMHLQKVMLSEQSMTVQQMEMQAEKDSAEDARHRHFHSGTPFDTTDSQGF